jgi:hypothetical protein
MRFNYKLSRSARRMTEAGEAVALRIATGILETIITLSSQPKFCACSTEREIDAKRGWAPAPWNFRPAPPV